MANNFTSDKFPRVKVLYDYDYTDEIDNSQVYMRVDEIFYLLNNDEEEWWQVCRPDSPNDHFYVPSTYVTVLENVNNGSADESECKKTDLNESKNSQGNISMDSFKSHSDITDETIYANVNTSVQDGSFRVQYHEHFKRPSDLNIQTEDDYVNLDKWREQAGLSPVNNNSSPNHVDKVLYCHFTVSYL